MFNPIPVYDPDSLFLEIDKRCNAYCAHCGNNSGGDTDIALENETISGVIQDAGRNGFTTLRIGGGEPFLNMEKLKHTVREGVKNGLAPEFINTNAYFANSVDEAKGILEELKDIGFRDTYRIKARQVKKRRFLSEYKDGNQNIEILSGGLGISFDKFHQLFVETQNIANLIRAYYEVFGSTEGLELHYVFAKNYQLNGKDVADLLNALSDLGFDTDECYKNREKDAFHEILSDNHESHNIYDTEDHRKYLRLKSGNIYIMEGTPDPTGRAKDNLEFELFDMPEDAFRTADYCCGILHEGPQKMGVLANGDVYAHAGFLCRSKGLYLGNIYETKFENLLEQGKNSLVVDLISLDGANMLKQFMDKAGIDTNIKSESLCHFCYQALSNEKTVDELKTHYSGPGRAKMLGYDIKKLRLRLCGMGIG